MVLRLKNDELDLMRAALLESIRDVRDDERVHCGGPSASGIELCRKRLRLEALLEAIDEQRASLAKAGSVTRVETIPLRRTGQPDGVPQLVA